MQKLVKEANAGQACQLSVAAVHACTTFIMHSQHNDKERSKTAKGKMYVLD